MPRTNLHTIRKAIRAEQTRDRAELRGAIVGRPLTIPKENGLNRQLRSEVGDGVHYRRTGQLALVYLFRDELRQNRGKTFHNRQQVEQVITQAPASARAPVQLHRAPLRLVEQPFEVSPYGIRHYWLTTVALRACVQAPERAGRPVDMRVEELAIANDLFLEDNDVADRPHLWLGAVSAPKLAAAQAALEPLEALLAADLPAGPVSLIPSAA